MTGSGFAPTTLDRPIPALRYSATSSVALNSPRQDGIKWHDGQPQQQQLIHTFETEGAPEDEAVIDRLVALKMASAPYSTHLERNWRAGLFTNLERLLDVDEWVPAETLPTVASYQTLMKMIVHNQVQKLPSLGATSDGKIVASWRAGKDRLVVECLPGDQVRWVASCWQGLERISAAGNSPVRFLRQALQPYNPEAWFG